MSEYKNLKNFFKEFKVSPYSLLNLDENSSEKEIKKAYHSKARLIHPDKNTTDTTLEFQILTMAFDLIIFRNKRYSRTHITDYSNEVIEIDSLPKNEKYQTCAPIHGYKSSRSVDDDNYSRIKLDSPYKLMNKFNTDEFNAIFEHLKEKSELKKSSSLIKKDIIGHNKTSLNMCQVITDGEYMIVGEESSLDDYTTSHGGDYMKSFSDIQQPSIKNIPKNIDYSRSFIKENTRKMKGSEIKSSVNTRSKPLNIKYNKSFADSQTDFLNNQIENMRKVNELNNSIIQSKKKIFQHSISY
jgi:curved DNA-binding protein CbpA